MSRDQWGPYELSTMTAEELLELHTSIEFPTAMKHFFRPADRRRSRSGLGSAVFTQPTSKRAA